jgi:trehalose synthase
MGVEPAGLVHALQNHDELTYELVHFWVQHRDDQYEFRGKPVTGKELRETIRQDLRSKLTGDHAPYNLLFTENGIACTTVSVIAAVLGFSDIENLEPQEIERIQRVHLLLAKFNAWQPGVFALSGWDLVGAGTIPPDSVETLVKDGDTRWINRGSYDLLGNNPSAIASGAGIPKAPTLYGNLPEQLGNSQSFVRQLQQLLKIREDFEIAISHQIEIPDVDHPSLLVMIHRLPSEQIQATVLNFSGDEVITPIMSQYFAGFSKAVDMLNTQYQFKVAKKGQINLKLGGYEGLSLVLS